MQRNDLHGHPHHPGPAGPPQAPAGSSGPSPGSKSAYQGTGWLLRGAGWASTEPSSPFEDEHLLILVLEAENRSSIYR